MFSRRKRRTGTNEVTTPVTDFGPDPRGTQLFHALSGVAQLGISGHDGLVYEGDKGDPSRTFNGDIGHQVQHFIGAQSAPMYGAARPIVPSSATFETAQAADALTSSPMRLFAARASRRRG